MDKKETKETNELVELNAEESEQVVGGKMVLHRTGRLETVNGNNSGIDSGRDVLPVAR